LETELAAAARRGGSATITRYRLASFKSKQLGGLIVQEVSMLALAVVTTACAAHAAGSS
jgi:hypothetical protein